jgi:UDP-N-acetylglucosamine diphosphorylase / glucose-1-phosphate thymidylyltransferase / UDP-N-acetylgalactosamine diphosphorylase / glucosamine-1-phosphate N-acetyltransferase / galactosamine-1-phosphate N-acetyltransferase
MASGNRRKLNIVMPMAGMGSRFRQAGFDRPKPLIDVLGRPMYAWATESLPLDQGSRLIFILLGSQPECPELIRDIEQRYARHKPIVLTVPELTAGQAITVLRAKDFINQDEPLLIHNADTAFEANSRWVEQAADENLDGALLVFPSQEKRWSFSRENANGQVDLVREKEVISPWASTGTYWFGRGSDFVRAAETRFQSGRREATEFYVGPLYNDLIQQGAKVKNFPIQKLYCFGTPEDLNETLRELKDGPRT